MMNTFNRIREFIWPILENDGIPKPTLLSAEDISINEKYLEKTLEYVLKNYESEKERERSVESKSALFIGTISVVTSIVIGVTTILVNAGKFNPSIFILVFLLFLLTLYMSRTVWFSIKALERQKYYSLSISDFLIKDADDVYYKKIIAEINNKISQNAITINNKVDSMTMAQEYFKRAIIVVMLYSFVLLTFFVLKSEINFSNYINQCIDSINRINLNGWNIIIIYILVITSLTISIKALNRKNK